MHAEKVCEMASGAHTEISLTLDLLMNLTCALRNPRMRETLAYVLTTIVRLQMYFFFVLGPIVRYANIQYFIIIQ